ncbi:MAG: ImmA/IrrE family metallo-endopeptidase [Phycisphaerae bacterium]
MLANRRELARQALAAATRTRIATKRALWDPICVFDLAEEMHVEVRFLDIPSMEGLYSKQPRPLILLPAERPASRQVYSCAHELGHHVAGHGTRFDELREEMSQNAKALDDSDEFLVECYAGYLMMPKMAVERAVSNRGWSAPNLTPSQAYEVAGFLGVGYTTLIKHMRWSLGLMDASKADSLLKFQPKEIRREWLGEATTTNVIVVDTRWTGRPIDMHVGELLVVPQSIKFESPHLRVVRENPPSVILEAIQPGIGRLTSPTNSWANFVRVSRAAYAGLARYRHLEEAPNA